MKLTITIEAEVSFVEAGESIKNILDEMLPYMADNVMVRSTVLED